MTTLREEHLIDLKRAQTRLESEIKIPGWLAIAFLVSVMVIVAISIWWAIYGVALKNPY